MEADIWPLLHSTFFRLIELYVIERAYLLNFDGYKINYLQLKLKTLKIDMKLPDKFDLFKCVMKQGQIEITSGFLIVCDFINWVK